ncbi:MAG: hypothetical protein BJ554DRAFT_5445 [Olpidium bornovanus]|uniref:Uncharacterized protein n=1 Tax=Olpidium bornovanus TaxID=278681 RepID=A0A8H7ZZI8_9FUNG|nr:MAG: hypothetical protein BJ554DRAFT_5445 [Olpidium bornovanus]
MVRGKNIPSRATQLRADEARAACCGDGAEPRMPVGPGPACRGRNGLQRARGNDEDLLNGVEGQSPRRGTSAQGFLPTSFSLNLPFFSACLCHKFAKLGRLGPGYIPRAGD